MGHNIGEIAPPANCEVGQALVWNGTNLECGSIYDDPIDNCTLFGTSNKAGGTGVEINVPEKCKFPSACTLILQTVYNNDNSDHGTGIVTMTQFPDGYWVSTYSYSNNVKYRNGDSVGNIVLGSILNYYVGKVNCRL